MNKIISKLLKFAPALESFNTYSVFIGTILGASLMVGTWVFAGRGFLREIVHEEILKEQKANRLYNAGYAAFAVNQENEGFEILDNLMDLQEQKKEDFSKNEREEILDKYLRELAICDNPNLQEKRLKKIQARFDQADIALDLANQLDVAWFKFRTGDSKGAKPEFEYIAKVYASELKFTSAASAYYGLFYCSLADGNENESLNMYLTAEKLDPVTYSRWNIYEYSPDHIRFANLYPKFAQTAKNFITIANSHQMQIAQPTSEPPPKAFPVENNKSSQNNTR